MYNSVAATDVSLNVDAIDVFDVEDRVLFDVAANVCLMLAPVCSTLINGPRACVQLRFGSTAAGTSFGGPK